MRLTSTTSARCTSTQAPWTAAALGLPFSSAAPRYAHTEPVMLQFLMQAHGLCPLWQLCQPALQEALTQMQFSSHVRAARLQGHPMWAPPRLSRKDREARLTESIKATLRNQGTLCMATLHAAVLECSMPRPSLCT